MKIELFYSPGCTRCEGPRRDLKTAVLQQFPAAQWIECNVLEDLDRAVALGVLSLPALAVDDRLVFPKLPGTEPLCAFLQCIDAQEGRST